MLFGWIFEVFYASLTETPTFRRSLRTGGCPLSLPYVFTKEFYTRSCSMHVLSRQCHVDYFVALFNLPQLTYCKYYRKAGMHKD